MNCRKEKEKTVLSDKYFLDMHLKPCKVNKIFEINQNKIAIFSKKLKKQDIFLQNSQKKNKSMRTRIAPTPSGFLHLGNVFSFLLTWLAARSQNGTILLRIDDLDAERRRTEYLDDIFRTLEWLQIDYEEGASGTADFLQNFSQTLFLEKYNSLINKLLEKKNLFPCACSRSLLKSQNPQGLHKGICAEPDPENEFALRIQVLETESIRFEDINGKNYEVNLAETVGDFVLRRRDGLPSYQIVSLAEDVEKKIDFVVRGEDLIGSTAMQLFLAQKLDLQAFMQTKFLHHKLIKDQTGNKLSKSAGSTSIKYLRENGAKPAQIYQLFSEQFLGKSNLKVEKIQDLLDFSQAESNPFAHLF